MIAESLPMGGGSGSPDPTIGDEDDELVKGETDLWADAPGVWDNAW